MGRRRGRDEWHRLIADWKSSGERASAFAARIGVASNTLYRWRAALTGARANRLQPTVAEIVELRPAAVAADARFEIEIDGRYVRVPAAFDEAALQRVLRVLEATR